MKPHIIILLMLIFACLNIHAQNQERIDSLLSALKNETSVSEKISIYSDLFDEYQESSPEKALQIATEYHDFALKNNDKTEAGIALGRKGIAYRMLGKIDEALDSYQQSLQIFTSLNDSTDMAISLNNIGMMYSYINDYNKAIEYYQKALNIHTRQKNQKYISNSLNSIGIIYRKWGKFDIAIDYYQKSLKIKEEIGDEDGIASTYGNIGNIYFDWKNYPKAIEYYEKALPVFKKLMKYNAIASVMNNLGNIYNDQKQFEKAMEYYNQTLEIYEKTNNKYGVETALDNLARLLIDMKQYKTAEMYAERVVKIAEELGDIEGIVIGNNSLGSIYSKTGQYQKALKYLNKSLETADTNQLAVMKIDNYYLLSDVYEQLNDYRSSLDYFKMYTTLKDTVFSQSNRKVFNEMQAKYETEKKQKEIELLNKEKEKQAAVSAAESKKQKIIILSVIIILLLVSIFAIIIYRNFLQKRKANILLAQQKLEIEEKNEELYQQNEEIAAQRDALEQFNIEVTRQRDEISTQHQIVTQQKEFIEFQKKEIDDSIHYAKRIQQALLPDLSVIARKPQADEAISEGKIASLPLAMTLDHFIFFRPKDVVSGDFYWATKIENNLIVCVADCTGHGVPGAFMSMLGISFLNEIVRKEGITQPNLILNELRKSVIDALKQKGESSLVEMTIKDGMDISLIAINTTPQAQTSEGSEAQTSEGLKPSEVLRAYAAQWAGANNPLWIVRKLKVERNKLIEATIETISTLDTLSTFELYELKGDKMPISIYVRMEDFTNHELQLNPGDIIYLMSDGYEDQFGGFSSTGSLRKFKSKKLRELLLNNAAQNMQTQHNMLESAFYEWKEDSEQIDDITILGIKI